MPLTSIAKHFLCNRFEVQTCKHWEIDRTYLGAWGWALKVVCCSVLTWCELEPAAGMDGQDQEPFRCASPLPLGRKDFGQSSRLLVMVSESGFPASAEKWYCEDFQRVPSCFLRLRSPPRFPPLRHRVSPALLLTSVFHPCAAAQRSCDLLPHGLTLTAGSQLPAWGQAFSSTGSCSWTAGTSCFSGFCLKLG